MAEKALVGFAIGVFFKQCGVGGKSAYGTSPMTESEVFALSAIATLHEDAGAIEKSLAYWIGFKESCQRGRFEDVAKMHFGVARNPAITLRDISLGINTDEIVCAVGLPEAGNYCVAVEEVVEDLAQGAHLNTFLKPRANQMSLSSTRNSPIW